MDEIDQDYIEKAFDDGVGLPSSFIVTNRIKIFSHLKLPFKTYIFNILKKITQTCFQVRGQCGLFGRLLLRLNKV